jgi:hypothetical protein
MEEPSMSEPVQFNGNSLPWLLEEQDPGPRYLALRDLVGLPTNNPELVAAQKTAHAQAPISIILDNMHPKGYWSKPGPGYNPKYFSTVWSLITLAQLGASVLSDIRISQACDYILNKNLTSQGQFSYNGTPSGTIDCLQGNLCAALVALGCNDARLKLAYEWMARTVTGAGLAPNTEKDAPLRYYAYKCGPLFACGANKQLPCAWGATKVMLALAYWPKENRTPLIEQAIEHGVDFLFSTDPVLANYPCGNTPKPSRDWWLFGFPVFYITDILQIVEALVGLGFGTDPRLANATQLIREKQDAQGRWSLEYNYLGKTWFDYGQKNQPSKWVTLRALKVLKAIER